VHTLRSLIMTAVTCSLVVVASPAIADVEIPEEWIGVWELDVAAYDCETNALLFSSTNLDTICPGSVFEDPNPSSITVECTSSADATTYMVHCEGSTEVLPGCAANFIYDATGTRDDNSYTSTATTIISYTGDCPLIPDSCQRTEITGTRISGQMDPCDSTPVESRSWATVKSYFR